jgi:asparagine synthetase B (glutamine-hydrolysing)
MSAPHIVGDLDRTLAWDGSRLYRDADLTPGAEPPLALRGAAGSVLPGGDGRVRIVRDPLGIGKLFWAEADGTVSVAARPWRLTQAGHDFDAIRAVPRGCVIDVDRDGAAERREIELGGRSSEPGAGIECSARTIRPAVSGYLAAISAAHPGARAFVCLSGGLDSSGIAVVAQEHFPDLTAVSFDLDRGRPSEDRVIARQLARDLGLGLLEATVTEAQLLANVDTALLEGIDWRDFNVHAALVNAALAEAIADTVADHAGPVLVLTGDLANEFLADYQPERYRGATYYRLPDLPRPALRRILVRGLDTSHREIGVFAAWGLTAVQPYAAAVDAYLALPDAFLADPDAKSMLCRQLFGEQLPGYVYARRKTRAQVGGAEATGVLGLCVDRGLDGACLKRRFAELHGVADPSALDRFIRAGLYRSGVPTTRIADARA